jgi:hypothetical protein
MKYLKIDNNQGFYFDQDKKQWVEIDKITKENLVFLLDKAISEDFEMDEFNEELIGHKAHKIVYKSIYEKFYNLIENKKSFKDDCDSQFRNAIEKYESKNDESLDS